MGRSITRHPKKTIAQANAARRNFVQGLKHAAILKAGTLQTQWTVHPSTTRDAKQDYNPLHELESRKDILQGTALLLRQRETKDGLPCLRVWREARPYLRVEEPAEGSAMRKLTVEDLIYFVLGVLILACASFALWVR